MGAEVLLMDEDTCATNLMIRDGKMQQLVNKDDEPITTFIDRAKQLFLEKNVSTVLVLGGIGDYFDIADQVIQMKNYRPLDVTSRAHQIVDRFSTKRKIEAEHCPFHSRQRIPISESIDPINDYGKLTIHARDVHRLHFGKQIIDLTDLEQIVELSQTKALGYAMEYAKKYMDNKTPMSTVIDHVMHDIDEYGLDVINEKISGHFARFRPFELAFTLNRLRGFNVVNVVD